MSDDPDRDDVPSPEELDDEFEKLLAAVVQEFEVTENEYRFTISGLKALADARGFGVSRRTIANWMEQLEEISFVREGKYESQRGVVYYLDRELIRALKELSVRGTQEFLERAGVEMWSDEYFKVVRKVKDPETAAETLRDLYRRGEYEEEYLNST